MHKFQFCLWQETALQNFFLSVNEKDNENRHFIPHKPSRRITASIVWNRKDLLIIRRKCSVPYYAVRVITASDTSAATMNRCRPAVAHPLHCMLVWAS